MILYNNNLPDHSISDMSVLGIESLGHCGDAVRLSREKMWMKAEASSDNSTTWPHHPGGQ